MTTKVKPSVLADTTVTAGTYGGSTQHSVFTVGDQGRLTYAANATPSIATTQLTGTINATQVANNQTYGINITGRATVANTADSISSASITGLTGEIKMWPTNTAPEGHLLCNGQAVSRSTYAALFSVIGTTFGIGNGTTTFNLPNYLDRMPIGAGNLYSANTAGGSADATVVSHTHSVTDPGHTHVVNGTAGNNPTTYNVATAGGWSFWKDNNLTTTSSTTGISIASTGSSGTNANLPPYLGIYFIIRHI